MWEERQQISDVPKSRGRPDTREERYESLKSLGRLLEYDMETELQSTRQLALPVIDVNPMYSKKLDRNHFSANDYTQQLDSARRNMLPPLLPDTNDKGHVDDNMTDIQGDNVEDSGPLNKAKIKYDIVINTSQDPCMFTDQSEESDYDVMSSNEDENIADSIENLRERIARFEALKSVRRPIYADDFQQYLGARYLEVFRRRSRDLRRANTSLDSISDLDTSTELQTTARSDNTLESNSYLSAEMSTSRNKLPPLEIPPRHERNLCGRIHKKEDKENSAMLGYNDIEYELSRSNYRSGIPHHAAKRAHRRYFYSHGLSAMLNDLRRRALPSGKT